MIQYIVILGAAGNIYGTFFYILDTIKGRTRPNRVSWFLWSATTFIGSAAAYSAGAGWAAFPVFISGVLALAVLLASFADPKAYWKLSAFDYLCGILSVLALALWVSTGDPVLAVAFSIFADAFAFIPTLLKSIKAPESESSGTYLGGSLNAATGLLAAKSFTFSACAFPLYLAVTSGLLFILVSRKEISLAVKNFFKQ